MTVTDRRARKARTVKPRKPKTNADRPIVAVIDESALDENGVLTTTDELITALRTLIPQIIVTANESASLLKRIQDRYGSNPNFDFRVSPIEREIFTGKDTGRRMVMSLTSVAYVGWKNEKCGRNNSLRNRYHLLIDPMTFSNKWLDERTLPAYMAWMKEIRDFCVAQNWNLRPTQGSVGRQALVDSRFYPEARRKVPRATNEAVRPHLPGNHYQLGDNVSLEREYEADYLDQTRCHHYHAMNASLPNANSLNGYGYFRNPNCGREFISDPVQVSQFLSGFMGMAYGRIYWPPSKRKQTALLPPCLAKYSSENLDEPVYFYTEDMPLFESLGVEVASVIAAWGSIEKDTGLATYAKWALDELETNGAQLWKKTLLLSPYGGLATTPRKHAVAFHQSRGGESRMLRSRFGTELPVKYHQTGKVLEPSTNNVLHRALIESSNRTETLLYAHYLESIGYRVLCVYVDALIVESDSEDIPPLYHPWRHDNHLTHLRFLSASQFASAQVLKLPGVSGAEHRQRVSLGTVRNPDGKQGLDRERIQRLAYEAWLDKRDTTRARVSHLDNASPEDRWAIFEDVTGRASFRDSLESAS